MLTPLIPRDERGRYPVFVGRLAFAFVTGDGDVLCSPCANAPEMSERTDAPPARRVIAFDLVPDNEHYDCGRCSAPIRGKAEMTDEELVERLMVTL